MAAASTAVNVLGKSLATRDRPRGPVPAGRRPARPPRTRSFPSGHAASAAAFATGVALEKPGLAAPVIVTAVAVGVSRVVTGAHYPSDVLAGFAIGAGAGAATLHWWPRAPASPGGDGVVLAVNMSAGTTSPKLVARLRAELPRAVVIETHAGQDLAGRLRRAAANARILGVAGGDGAARPAAAIALETALPLLVIPAGTFNHFAADLGVWSVDDALAALRAGEAVLVDVGMAGHRSFINTSSTGVYVDLVRARQELEKAVGRRPALLVALAKVLWRGRPHELMLNGRRRRLWLYFAGNCGYEPAGMAPADRPRLCDGAPRIP